MSADADGDSTEGARPGMWAYVATSLREHTKRGEAALIDDIAARHPGHEALALQRLRTSTRRLVKFELARFVVALLTALVAWRLILWLPQDADGSSGSWWLAVVSLLSGSLVLSILWSRHHGYARVVAATWSAYQLSVGLPHMRSPALAAERYARAETNLLRYRPRTRTLALRARWRSLLDFDARKVGELEGDFTSLVLPSAFGAPPAIWEDHRKVLADVLGHLLVRPMPEVVPQTESEAVSRLVLGWRGATLRGRFGASFAALGAVSAAIAIGGFIAKALGWVLAS